MYNPDFIEKVILPYNILNTQDAEILAIECQQLKITPEFFMLACRVLSKHAILQLNLITKGCVNPSRDEVLSHFDLCLLHQEIEKLKRKSHCSEILTLPEVGSIIDKYEIKSILGKGATATVYLAYHQFLKIEVALKVLSPQLILSDNTIQDKFLDEAMNSARLCHSNLIRILDADKRGKYTYIVMEYINGKSLENVLKEQGSIKPVNVIKIMMELTKVLEYASGTGLIHRDIKPGNIMISNQSEVKLADFGLAKIINEPDKYQTISGQIYGTPFYMSPEQFMDSGSVNEKSDIYSMGATMYHLLTGKLPFETNSIAKIIYMHLNEKPVPPANINNNISIELSNIIMKMMEKEPSRRYNSYNEIFNDLKEAGISYSRATVNKTLNPLLNNTAEMEKAIKAMEKNLRQMPV